MIIRSSLCRKGYTRDMTPSPLDESIKELSNYIDRTLESESFNDVSGSEFMGLIGLYACTRQLRTMQTLVDAGMGDMIGSNLRMLYDTWVFSHLLMLSDFEDARKTWSNTRHEAEKLIRHIDTDRTVEYPAEAPEPAKGDGVEERAKQLSKKLQSVDPENATMPTYCYNNIYRSESHMSDHANLDSISRFVQPGENDDFRIGFTIHDDQTRGRITLAVTITQYFARQVLLRRGELPADFVAIEDRLASIIDGDKDKQHGK